jgi:hypothetical protein
MLHLILLHLKATCCSDYNVKTAATREDAPAGSRHADPFSTRATMLSTSFDHGGAEGDLTELNGWTSPQMLRRYAASARSARARRSYDRVMEETP